jgi:hypothetical protein
MNLLSAKFVSVVLVLLALAAFPRLVAADQPLGNMNVKSLSLIVSDDGGAVLHATGTGEELGKCACYGEITFGPGEDVGTLDGMGVVVFRAANGDVLVGVIAAQLDTLDDTFSAEIHWRDAVTLSDGTTVASTGRFLEHRPPGFSINYAKGTVEIG